MPVEAACPSCDGKFRLPDAAAGKKIRCPKCKGPLDVPPLNAEAAAPPVQIAVTAAPVTPAPIVPVPIVPVPVTAAPPSEALKTTWRTATQEPAPVEPARVETPRVEVSKPVQPGKSVVIKSPPAVASMEPPQKPATAPLTAPKPKPAAPVVPATPALAPAAVTAPVITTEQWFLRGDDGETFGPVDRPTLNAWQAEGRMTADSQLLKQGTEQWQWASDLYPDLEEPEEPAAATAPAASSSIHREDGQQSRIRPTPSSKDSPAPEADDDEEVGLSPHSKPVAFLLALTLGMFGIHRFYLGYVGIGLAMFFTFGGLLMWSITDALRILFGHVPDAEGLKLRD